MLQGPPKGAPRPVQTSLRRAVCRKQQCCTSCTSRRKGEQFTNNPHIFNKTICKLHGLQLDYQKLPPISSRHSISMASHYREIKPALSHKLAVTHFSACTSIHPTKVTSWFVKDCCWQIWSQLSHITFTRFDYKRCSTEHRCISGKGRSINFIITCVLCRYATNDTAHLDDCVPSWTCWQNP